MTSRRTAGDAARDLHQLSSTRAEPGAAPFSGNARTPSTGTTGWIAKVKDDQRTLARVGDHRLRQPAERLHPFAIADGVVVTDFACAAAVASLVRPAASTRPDPHCRRE